MNQTAKFALCVAGGIVVLSVVGKSLMGASPHAAYVESLNKRPYTERNLAEEYGLDPNRSTRRSGPLAYMSVASDAVKLNNCLEAEASRIQIEFEDKLGTVGSLLAMAVPGGSVNASKIARQRFEDQGLLPKKE